MKRLVVMALFAGIIGGCNTHNEEKAAAVKRWRNAQARVVCGVGVEQLKVGDLEKAQASATQALSRDPDYVPARILLARILLERGRYAEAAEELHKAEELQPENAEIHYLLGVALEKRNEYAEALESYQKAGLLDPGNAAYVTASAEVLVAMGKSREALELLEKRLERSEDDASVLALAGEVAMMVGEPARAVSFFQRCCDLNPKSVTVRESLAKAYFFSEQYAEALEAFTKLRDYPEYANSAWVHVIIGDCYVALEQPKAARGAYETAANLDPGAGPIWVRVAKAALAAGDIPAANAAARQALTLMESSPEAAVVLGYALLHQGQAKDALQLLSDAVQKDPRQATLWCLLGRCHEALGQRDQALTCYRKALEAQPDSALARRLLAAAGEHG